MSPHSHRNNLPEHERKKRNQLPKVGSCLFGIILGGLGMDLNALSETDDAQDCELLEMSAYRPSQG
jgi:hypothetical protein